MWFTKYFFRDKIVTVSEIVHFRPLLDKNNEEAEELVSDFPEGISHRNRNQVYEEVIFFFYVFLLYFIIISVNSHLNSKPYNPIIFHPIHVLVSKFGKQPKVW